MEQKQYSYTRKIGRTTYTIIVRESENAKSTVYEKLKRLMLNDFEHNFGGGAGA